MATETTSNSWSDLAISLYDKLTGRNAEIVYEFNDLEIFVPLAADEDTAHAKWKVNGIIKIRTREASQK